MTALWPPAADETSTYVRRLRSGNWLVYHRENCRHVRGHEDAEVVSADEVRRALEIAPTFVRFRGKRVYLYPCRQCLYKPRLRSWP